MDPSLRSPIRARCADSKSSSTRHPTMETVATQASPDPSSQLKGLKKVFSNRSTTSINGDRNGGEVGNSRGALRASTESVLDKSPTRHNQDSSSSISGGSGIRKLIPGRAKRKRRRNVNAATTEDAERARGTLAPTFSANRSTGSLSQDGENSLLTDDSDPEP